MIHNALPRLSRARRWLRRLVLAGCAAVVLLVVILVSIRLYFNDTRLTHILQQTLHERLQAEVRLGAVEVALLDGIVLTNLHIGPLPGFTLDTLHVGRMALRWRPSEALRGRLTLPEVALTGLDVAYEENAQGRSIDALRRAIMPVSPPAGPGASQPVSPPASSSSLQQPELPVPLRVERLTLQVHDARMVTPEVQVRLSEINVDGHLNGEGTALQFALWLGLGEHAASGAPSHLHLETTAPHRTVDMSQRLGIQLDSLGLGDIRMALDWSADIAKVVLKEGEPTLAPVHLSGIVRADTNLLTQTFALPAFHCRVGAVGAVASPSITIDVVLQAQKLLTAPQLAVSTLAMDANLDALQPYVTAFMPNTGLAGTVHVGLAPLQADIKTLQAWQELATRIHVQAHNVAYVTPTVAVHGLSSDTTMQTQDGNVMVAGQVTCDKAIVGANEISGVQVQAQMTAPLTPWLGGDAVGAVPAHLALRVADAHGPAYVVENVRLTVDSQAPVALLRGASSAVPWSAHLQGQVDRAAAGAQQLTELGWSADATARDVRGQHAEVKAAAHVAHASVQQGNDIVQLPDMGLHLDVARHGDDYELRALRLRAASDLELVAHGAVHGATSAAPRFHPLQLQVPAFSLAKVVALLPPGLRPDANLAGTCASALVIDGTIPYQELLTNAQGPMLPRQDDPQWDAALPAYVAWIQTWVNRLDAGLPVTLGWTLELADVDYRAAHADIRNLDVQTAFNVRPHGPAVTARMTADLVKTDETMHKVAGHVELSQTGGHTAFAMNGRIDSIDVPGQPAPLKGVGLDAALSYHWGGDLVVDTFAANIANRGIHVSADGRFAEPLKVALRRAWTQPSMPGMESRLHWLLAMHSPKEQQLDPAGDVFAGDLSLEGQLSLDEGLLALTGNLQMDHMNFESGSTAITGMTGALPFDVRLFFGQRPDATVIQRNLPLGGGIVSLMTANEDIRNRPARPVYYDRLRPYRPGVGLTAQRIDSGPYELLDFAFEGRVVNGMLLADWIAMNVLGGDVVGDMAYQLGRDSTVRGDMTFKVSNIDASYFPALKLKPGPDSELSADLRMSFLFGDLGRDLTMNMNVTKIGAKALDRFLQLLDPESKDAKLQQTRSNLQFVRIQELAMWIRYENLNMDLAYDPIIAIPFTHIGYRPIDRELLRRYAIGESLDVYLQPAVDRSLAPLLGWTHGRS